MEGGNKLDEMMNRSDEMMEIVGWKDGRSRMKWWIGLDGMMLRLDEMDEMMK